MTRRGLGTEGRTTWQREEEGKGEERGKLCKIFWSEREKSWRVAKRLAVRRDVVGEGCSSGTDLCSTSLFPCPMALILGRKDVLVSVQACKSVVGVCAWPVPQASGLCPSLSLNMGRKESFLVSGEAEKCCCAGAGKELKRARELELLSCPRPS